MGKRVVHSLRGRKAAKIDKTTTSARFLKLITNSKPSRLVSSRVSQLKILRAPLNQYLEQFKTVDGMHCPASRCGALEEFVAHFLLACPGYTHGRWVLEKKKNKHLTLETLLGDVKFSLARKLH